MTIDPACCTATVGAGATWADVVAEASRHGLAPVLGEWSHRSAVSDTLCGGLGWLARRHGLAERQRRQLRAGHTRRPDGRRDSADAHPELFWALSGAGDGSLGVVASIEIELHPLGPVYAGAFDVPDRPCRRCARPVADVDHRSAAGADVVGGAGIATRSPCTGAGRVRSTSVRQLVDEWRQWRAPDVDTWAERALADVDAISDAPAVTGVDDDDQRVGQHVARRAARRAGGDRRRDRRHGRRCRRDPARRWRSTVAQRGGRQRPRALRSVPGDAGRPRRRSRRAPPPPGAVDHRCRLSRPHRRRRACRPHARRVRQRAVGSACAPSRPPSTPATASVTGS